MYCSQGAPVSKHLFTTKQNKAHGLSKPSLRGSQHPSLLYALQLEYRLGQLPTISHFAGNSLERSRLYLFRTFQGEALICVIASEKISIDEGESNYHFIYNWLAFPGFVSLSVLGCPFSHYTWILLIYKFQFFGPAKLIHNGGFKEPLSIFFSSQNETLM